MKQRTKITVILVLAILLILTTGVLVFFMKKPKIEQFYDENGAVLQGSIAERVFVEINGKKNGMIIRGKCVDNPVILFISGGPGVPEYWLNEYYGNKIEDSFTVCWWDYPGEGLSYDSKLKAEDVTVASLEEDAVAVTEYLKDRFGQEKVILMGHSAGTMLAARLAAGHPELYYCYFAMGQAVGDQYERCTSSYQFMKKMCEENGNQKTIDKMHKLVEVDENDTVVSFKKEPIGKYWEGVLLQCGCATTREMRSDAAGIFLPQMKARCYTGKEKINYWLGKAFLSKTDYIAVAEMKADASLSFDIPVYFIQGYYDYTSPTPLVENFYQNIEAKEKKIKIFEDSAHSPLWEENDAVMDFILENDVWNVQ